MLPAGKGAEFLRANDRGLATLPARERAPGPPSVCHAADEQPTLCHREKKRT